MTLIVLIGSSESFTYSKVKNNTKFYKVAEGSSLYSVIEDLALEPMPKLLLKIYLKTNGINLAQAGLLSFAEQILERISFFCIKG
jgi:hypothetical protein